MSGRDWRHFGRLHARLYRALGGRFVGSVGLGRMVLLLTTTGRKSGVQRTTPLVFMPHGSDLIVYPSNGGKESAPAWWLNLEARPVASVQIGKETHRVRARPATESEFREIWPKAERYNPHWRDYARSVARPIPLVILERVDVQGSVGGS
ncbi:MAG: nitroreductase/quinone reductase family protein [Polyangiales bacterium]